MLKHITAVLVIGLTLAGPVAAQTKQRPDVRADRPKILMAKRIREGVRSGRITPDELAEIRQRVQAFRADAKRLRAGGALTREDRRELRRQWRQISRLVFVKKHR